MSSKKAPSTSPFSALLKGGRKRKGNLEDLIHQFIIQDYSKSTITRPPQEPEEDSLLAQLNQYKKVKKTPQKNQVKTEAETLSKISTQEPPQSIIELEQDNNLPMFPPGYHDGAEEESKKKNTRTRKVSTSKSNKSPQKSNNNHKNGKVSAKKEPPKRVPRWKKSSVNKASVVSKESGNQKLSEKMEEEEEGMPKDFMFDDNNEEDDSQHEARLQFWLQPENIVDDKGRRPDEEDYNPGTLKIPEEEFNRFQTVQQKYWEWKTKYFDKVVAFKRWMCYFFYANDALLIHRLWDTKLSYYYGKVYTYVSEKALFEKAPSLLDAGYQMVILKQPEEYSRDPDIHKHTREVFQILTKGTYAENPEMTYASQYCLCIYEQGDNVGLVYFDTTTYQFYLGEFKDDENKSNLRTILTKVKPAEVVYMKKHLDPETQNMIKNLPSKPAFSKQYIEGEQFRSLASILDDILDMFNPQKMNNPNLKVPELINSIYQSSLLELKNMWKKQAQAQPEGQGQGQQPPPKINEQEISNYFTIKALNICLNYLKDLMLADHVFTLGKFHPYDLALEKKSTLYLDSQALQNLEVLDVDYMNTTRENRSLFGYMDKTVSPYGKRMFRKWLVSPLLDEKEIEERLQAVEDLISNQDIADYYQSQIKDLPDLERLITRIYGLAGKKRMVMMKFEEFVKNKLLDFLNILDKLEKVEVIIDRFEPWVGKFKSKRLAELVTLREVDLLNNDGLAPGKGLFPRMGPILKDLKDMVYVKDGLLVPVKGLNLEVDELLVKIEEVKERFQMILEEQRDFFKFRYIQYVHTKHKYELEIPEDVLQKVPKPKDYVITSKKKGFIRLHNPEIEEKANLLRDYEFDLQRALSTWMAGYFLKFYEKNMYWNQIVSCLSELDCLCGLAKFAQTMTRCCRPVVVPASDSLVFELKDMVHPCIVPINPRFVPNDLFVEDPVDTFLITGPNMGGKSTFLRQIGLAVVMAQVGSFVPATSFRFSVVDRIFTRIGASDRIMEGKSTFFVELEETWKILMEASRNSLVIMDELGRGTSTYDGVSIAYATLKYLAEYVRCITLFATHYHLLLEEFRLYRNVKNYYMASEVDNEKEEIQFKYKFVKGEADKSYGIIISKMAGIPENVLSIAKEKAAFMTTEKRNIGFEKSLTDKFNKTIEELERVEVADVDVDVDRILEELSHLVH